MSNTWKAALIGLILALAMLTVILVAGFLMWGSEWNMTGVPLIGLATGFVAHRIAKSHYQRLRQN